MIGCHLAQRSFSSGLLEENNKIIILQKSHLTPELNIDTKVKICIKEDILFLIYITMSG